MRFRRRMRGGVAGAALEAALAPAMEGPSLPILLGRLDSASSLPMRGSKARFWPPLSGGCCMAATGA